MALFKPGRGGRLTLALLVAAAAGGCASAPAQENSTSACDGVAVLVVFNSTSQMVEVLEEDRSNPGASHRIARLGPGTHEVTVRGDGDYIHRVVPVATGGVDRQRQITSSGTIRHRRECRPADGRAP